MKFKFLGLVALATIVSVSPSWAEDAKKADTAAPAAKEARTPKTIVIDVQRIMAESDAAKSVRAQVGDLRKNVQADVAKQETALRSEEQELVKQQGKISQDEFTKKRQAFEQKVASTRRTVDGKVSALDKAVNKASGQIEKELQAVLFELAKTQGAGLVLPKQAVLIAETAMDFTDQALTELNKRLPKVTVTVEKADPAPAAKTDDKKSDSKTKK